VLLGELQGRGRQQRARADHQFRGIGLGRRRQVALGDYFLFGKVDRLHFFFLSLENP